MNHTHSRSHQFALSATVISAVALMAACSEQPPEPSAGELVYKGTCKVCHAQGINGAPIVGNKKMWGPRIEQGIPTLVEHASNGYGLMPAKGGNTDLTTEQITAAVEYMVSQVEK
ncbi:cytochrome c5 family protein [Neiella sp. HB171785]|uniref:Cytochrome c5 family protein n=1 Tax=Neiella litorisoli TaxID=2771431 RepID=A0A8J6QTB7_9GAMM|nr:c-type cytochrome [Neiella litorisoli]MBD1387823.1 cytochrome c5 family protein [Neiella litorisoli]